MSISLASMMTVATNTAFEAPPGGRFISSSYPGITPPTVEGCGKRKDLMDQEKDLPVVLD